MIWMTWRQFRPSATAAAAALIALAAGVAATRPSLLALYTSARLPGCHAACVSDANNFLNSVQGSYTGKIFCKGIGLVYLVPALIGLFWGAPLIAREFDSGTFRLAWSQSVTRARWATVKPYQPAGRYWELQSAETALYLVLAFVLAGLCYWAVRRRQRAA